MIPFFAQQSPTAEIEDIKGIVMLEPEPSVWMTFVIVAISLLVLLLLGGLIWFLIHKFSGAGSEMPAEVKALRKLQTLQQSGDTMRSNTLSLEISETLKDFLKEKFDDRIRYETAHEFLTRFASSENPPSQVPPTVHQDLKSFVKMSEELKFGSPPDAQKKTASLFQLAHNVVNLSRVGNSDTAPSPT